MSDPQYSWENEILEAARALEQERMRREMDGILRSTPLIVPPSIPTATAQPVDSRSSSDPEAPIPGMETAFSLADYTISPRGLYCSSCGELTHRYEGTWYNFDPNASLEIWGITWNEYYFAYLRFTCRCGRYNSYEFSIQRSVRDRARTHYPTGS